MSQVTLIIILGCSLCTTVLYTPVAAHPEVSSPLHPSVKMRMLSLCCSVRYSTNIMFITMGFVVDLVYLHKFRQKDIASFHCGPSARMAGNAAKHVKTSV